MTKTTTAAKAKPAAAKMKPQSAAPRTPIPYSLGDVLRCRITGFTGIAACYAEYLYGCRRWGLMPALDKDGKPSDWVHFDEPQLERVATAGVMRAALPVTGGPRPDAPAR